jgi:hypothetical protein
VQQHLQRLDGVAKADVSLREGTVEITPKSDGDLDPYRILKAAYDSGVSVTELKIVATGSVEPSPGGLQLRLNSRRVLDIQSGPGGDTLKPFVGKQATVKGVFYRKPAGKGKPKLPTTGLQLEITEVVDGR